MSIPQFSTPDDQNLRVQALEYATRNNNNASATDDEILVAACKYYKFLSGQDDGETTPTTPTETQTPTEEIPVTDDNVPSS